MGFWLAKPKPAISCPLPPHPTVCCLQARRLRCQTCLHLAALSHRSPIRPLCSPRRTAIPRLLQQAAAPRYLQRKLAAAGHANILVDPASISRTWEDGRGLVEPLGRDLYVVLCPSFNSFNAPPPLTRKAEQN